MVRFLARATLSLIGDAVGLIVAAVVLDGMALNGAAFIIDVLIFTAAFIVLQPLIIKVALQHSSAMVGGSALLATLVALIVTDVLSDGLSISGAGTWVLATIIVWAASLLAGVLLPLVLFKKTLGRKAAGSAKRVTTWG
jgi:hypothetical protein